jgi:hypothetical protein
MLELFHVKEENLQQEKAQAIGYTTTVTKECLTITRCAPSLSDANLREYHYNRILLWLSFDLILLLKTIK